MTGVSLTSEEARVLGCLMEKSVTTPDNYPLSVNALVNACNQTTNREPIVSYSENVVEHALDTLREKELTRRVKSTGQRVIKHRHVAEEALNLDRPESTLLGVLLLRGAQTPGELKQRTERWHSFRSLADIEDALARLAAGEFIRRLEPRPAQQRGRWLQLLAPVAVAPASVETRARVVAAPEAPADEPAAVEREPVAPPPQPHSLEV